MRKADAATCILVLLLLAVGGLPASEAVVSTTIVPGKSLGPAQLGMTQDDIARVFGEPSPARGEDIPFPDWDVTVTFSNSRAVRFATSNPQFRTASGAGVGIRIDDATRLVGDPNLDMTTTEGDIDVLYPATGIGFVFRHGIAVDVFVVAPGSVSLANLSLIVPPPGSIRPGNLTIFLRPSLIPPTTPPPAPPAKTSVGAPAGGRSELALENVTSVVDTAKGLFRISGEVTNVGDTPVDGVTVAATFVKSSGDQARRQAVFGQPVAPGASAPFSLETPLLQTIVGGDFVVRYTAEATAKAGRLLLVQGSYTVSPEAYAELAQGQVKVDVQFAAPSNTAVRVQVLVSITSTGSIPPAWIRDVLVEIPFASGAQQVHLLPGQTVTILVTPVVGVGVVSPRFRGFIAPALLGAPVVLNVSLALP